MLANDVPALMRLRFIIVTGFTGSNLLLGLLALMAAAHGATALAAWALLCCVLLDGCDGSLARRWQVTSSFGAQLDSLADMTSFIIASVALIYYWTAPTTPLWLTLIAGGFYALSGAIRLARFNCTVPNPSYFQGIPTTLVAAIVAANYLVGSALDAYWVLGLVILLAVLMVSLFPYPKLAALRPTAIWLLPLITIGALTSLSWTIWVLTVVYICSGPVIWLCQRLWRSK
ncbi:MAG: CDP-alcohol phosphatidyltransferase [Candidatus Viridilinea halotolerans]|uniref:CDP-alcohol phosphatidyltransferase n=1 Tax=Candidatus Viridilinea halotolerans TaxID=2491704 RepID=A0A426TVZ4_9CHLR|nr:MAG: CDP-alcohol phosphatidyltransferase [Candidatus Viridilinea halotolerans]